MNTIEIFYFSGTGNSLHIAKLLQKNLPDVKLTPIVKYLDSKDYKSSAKSIGFIYPLYFTTVPYQVREFIRNTSFNNPDYVFSIVTRGRTYSLAEFCLGSILKKKNLRLNSHFVLNMTMNTPTGLFPAPGNKNWYKTIAKENIDKLELLINEKMNLIKNSILNKSNISNKSILYPFRLLSGLLFARLTNNDNQTLNFFTDESCIGCGKCEKVCLSSKIKLIDGKPNWQEEKKCFYCFACFNSCPKQAIILNNYKDKKGRFIHPDVTVEELANQK